MRLDAITLEHFRNYAHQSVTFDPSVNVIVGENAQGKTNLLEPPSTSPAPSRPAPARRRR